MRVIDGHEYPTENDPHTLTLTHDDVLILSEFFGRLEQHGSLEFGHPAEMIALGRLTGQLEAIPWEVFNKDYQVLVNDALRRRAKGFEGDVPGLGNVRVEDDGTLTRPESGDRA